MNLVPVNARRRGHRAEVAAIYVVTGAAEWLVILKGGNTFTCNSIVAKQIIAGLRAMAASADA